MKIAVIGSLGQLAQTFQSIGDGRFSFFGREKVDVTQRTSLLVLKDFDLIINCSAFTQVDAAESSIEEAYSVNRRGVMHLVEFCEEHDTKLIHFSTDFVFNGESHKPYTEEDYTDPQSIYGSSKLAGEEVILQSSLAALVIRTSWLYSPYGTNFCKTMLRLAQQRDTVSVVHDQIGSPTSTIDLVRAVIEIIDQFLPEQPELLHITNSGQCSWAEFAEGIFDSKGLTVKVDRIKSASHAAAAKRPAYSVLSNEKLLFRYGIVMRPWKEALNEVLSLL